MVKCIYSVRVVSCSSKVVKYVMKQQLTKLPEVVILCGIVTILHVSRTYTFAMAKCTYSLLCGVLNLFVKYIMKSACTHILLELHLAYFALLFSYT